MTVVVIKGDDETLISQAVRQQITELTEGIDPALMVDEVTESHYDTAEGLSLTPLLLAAETVPLLTERRLILARNLALFATAASVAPLTELLESLPSYSDLLLVWEKGSTSRKMPAVPKALAQALSEAGAEIIETSRSASGRKGVMKERLGSAPVLLDHEAQRVISDHYRDDIGALDALFEVLKSTYGRDAIISASDVLPLLGQAGDVPPWELTDAIDSGDIALALGKLERMMFGGERHPLQIMAVLHGHYQSALVLDGSGANEQSAAGQLGVNSAFRAKKALALSRRLGTERLAEIFRLLAAADVASRGASGLEGQTVLSVLVARLARLNRF